jgi:hypothetical protein
MIIYIVFIFRLPVLNMKKITDDVTKNSIPAKKDLSGVYLDSIRRNRERSIHEKLRKISADSNINI